MFQDILPRESSYSKSPPLPRSKPRSKDRLLRVRVYTSLRGEGKSLTLLVGVFPGRNGGSVISRSTETWFVPIMERRKRGRREGGIYDKDKGRDAIVICRGELRLLSHSDRTSQFDFPPLSHVDRHTAIDTQGGLAQSLVTTVVARSNSFNLEPIFLATASTGILFISRYALSTTRRFIQSYALSYVHRRVENFQKNCLSSKKARRKHLNPLLLFRLRNFRWRAIFRERERETGRETEIYFDDILNLLF